MNYLKLRLGTTYIVTLHSVKNIICMLRMKLNTFMNMGLKMFFHAVILVFLVMVQSKTISLIDDESYKMLYEDTVENQSVEDGKFGGELWRADTVSVT